MKSSSGKLLVSDYIESRWSAELDLAAPGISRVVLRPDGAEGDLGDVEIAFFSSDFYPERAAEFMQAIFKCDKLGWLHSFSAGVDHPVFRSIMENGVRLTNSAGSSAVPIAHTVIMYILALSRNLTTWMGNQRDGIWAPHDVMELEGKVLAVAGLGNIGSEVARLGQAFGMRVIGMRREPRGDEAVEAWPLDRWHELIALADYLVLTLPLNAQSRGILDAVAISKMKPEGYVINVGRGELVEEEALVEALIQGRLAGAALDVFETEPLPADNALWSMANVLVTPHSAGDSKGSADRAAKLFIENLGRYVHDQALLNEIFP